MLLISVTITWKSIGSVNSYCDKVTITGRFVCSTNSDLTITGRSICNVHSYCDNNDNNEEVYMQYTCSTNNYGDNNGEVYM